MTCVEQDEQIVARALGLTFGFVEREGDEEFLDFVHAEPIGETARQWQEHAG